jgi:hypothetical protein
VTPTNGFDAASTSGVSSPNAHLLVRANKTDLCLACHASNYSIGSEYAPDVNGAATDTPGGDFDSAITTASKGHNPYHATGGVISQDSTFSTNIPPGSSTALWEWSCLSCHTPHKDTSATGDTAAYAYRLLRKKLKGPGSSGTYTDVSSALTLGDSDKVTPLATSSANVDAEAATKHNVYRVTTNESDTNGLGAWCAGCHGNFHGASNTKSGSDWIRHPTNELIGSSMATNFGNLVVSGKAFIPMETTRTSGSFTTTTDLSATAADGAKDQVFCLSCHKAHATAYANATRWDCTAASGSNDGCNRCHKKGE